MRRELQRRRRFGRHPVAEAGGIRGGLRGLADRGAIRSVGGAGPLGGLGGRGIPGACGEPVLPRGVPPMRIEMSRHPYLQFPEYLKVTRMFNLRSVNSWCHSICRN